MNTKPILERLPKLVGTFWHGVKYRYYIWRAGGDDGFLVDIIMIVCVLILIGPLFL
jgi:hypothetical protein